MLNIILLIGAAEIRKMYIHLICGKRISEIHRVIKRVQIRRLLTCVIRKVTWSHTPVLITAFTNLNVILFI
jgi:hypothetical protein